MHGIYLQFNTNGFLRKFYLLSIQDEGLRRVVFLNITNTNLVLPDTLSVKIVPTSCPVIIVSPFFRVVFTKLL